MVSLYNCRHSGDQYRISKFDHHFDLESSYLCDADACECPAGHRPTCRHRQMLPKFVARGAVNTGWFYDYSRGGWVQGEIEPAPEVVIEGDGITTVQVADTPAEYDPADTITVAPQAITTPAPTRAIPTIRRRV